MFQLALDGPSGSGKSTVAKAVARLQDLHYVDTGAMYRALGLSLLEAGVDTYDQEAVREALKDFDVVVSYDEDGAQEIFVNGKNQMPFIRTQAVADVASRTSAYPEVRQKLLDAQQSLAERFDVVMDGRDIGTVILPRANLKIFVTATPEERAMRRYKELLEKGQEPESYEKILAEQLERDKRDSERAVSPLKKAEDAVLLDTTEMSLDEVIAKVSEMVERCR